MLQLQHMLDALVKAQTPGLLQTLQQQLVGKDPLQTEPQTDKVAYTAVAIEDVDAHDATAVGIPAVEHANADADADDIRETANNEDSPIIMNNNLHGEMRSALTTAQAGRAHDGSNALTTADAIASAISPKDHSSDTATAAPSSNTEAAATSDAYDVAGNTAATMAVNMNAPKSATTVENKNVKYP